MSELIVTVTGEDALGRLVSGQATAEVLDTPPCPPGGPIKHEFARLLEFTRIAERHLEAFRRDLERFVHREREHDREERGDGWTGGGDRF